jgi:uncharacterized RDD family membrane protein YckC
VTDESIRIGNPFAPPLADVADVAPASASYVLASRWSRLAAVLLDSAFFLLVAFALVALMVPGIFTLGWLALTQYAIIKGLGWLYALLFAGFIALASVHVVLLWQGGQTIGKRIVGVRIVRSNGDRVSFPRLLFLRWIGTAIVTAIPRWLVQGMGAHQAGIVVGALCGLGGLLLIFGSTRRCLHDYVADTCVATAESSTRATRAGVRAGT